MAVHMETHMASHMENENENENEIENEYINTLEYQENPRTFSKENCGIRVSGKRRHDLFNGCAMARLFCYRERGMYTKDGKWIDGRTKAARKEWLEQLTPEQREERKKDYQNRIKNGAMPNMQPKFNDGHELAYKMAIYVAEQHSAEEPLTMAGCAIACGTTRRVISRYGEGEKDSWCMELEDRYRDKLDGEALFIYDYLIGGKHEGKKEITLSEVVNNYREIASAEREKRLYKRGSVADIFALKAVDGWQDDTNKGVTNQTLVITNGESAEAALKLLGYTKSE